MIIGVYTGSFESGIRFYRLTPDIPRTFLYVSMFALLVLIASFSLSWLSLYLDNVSHRDCLPLEQGVISLNSKHLSTSEVVSTLVGSNSGIPS